MIDDEIHDVNFGVFSLPFLVLRVWPGVRCYSYDSFHAVEFLRRCPSQLGIDSQAVSTQKRKGIFSISHWFVSQWSSAHRSYWRFFRQITSLGRRNCIWNWESCLKSNRWFLLNERTRYWNLRGMLMGAFNVLLDKKRWSWQVCQDYSRVRRLEGCSMCGQKPCSGCNGKCPTFLEIKSSYFSDLAQKRKKQNSSK